MAPERSLRTDPSACCNASLDVSGERGRVTPRLRTRRYVPTCPERGGRLTLPLSPDTSRPALQLADRSVRRDLSGAMEITVAHSVACRKQGAFAHSEAEVQPCVFVKTGKTCPRGDSCGYSHTFIFEELAATGGCGGGSEVRDPHRDSRARSWSSQVRHHNFPNRVRWHA